MVPEQIQTLSALSFQARLHTSGFRNSAVLMFASIHPFSTGARPSVGRIWQVRLANKQFLLMVQTTVLRFLDQNFKCCHVGRGQTWAEHEQAHVSLVF